MTISDLIAAFRTEADDIAQPPLWSDAEIVGYLNDAENEACIRAGLLIDDQSIRFAAGKNKASLATNALDVLRIYRATSNTWLERGSVEDLERRSFGGSPGAYAVLGHTLYIYPAPTVPEVLIARISRLPTEPLALTRPRAEPEIPVSEHVRLLDWALHRAFSKRDADAFEGNRAMSYAERFEQHFGPRPSAHARRQYREAARHCVKYNAF